MTVKAVTAGTAISIRAACGEKSHIGTLIMAIFFFSRTPERNRAERDVKASERPGRCDDAGL